MIKQKRSIIIIILVGNWPSPTVLL